MGRCGGRALSLCCFLTPPLSLPQRPYPWSFSACPEGNPLGVGVGGAQPEGRRACAFSPRCEAIGIPRTTGDQVKAKVFLIHKMEGQSLSLCPSPCACVSVSPTFSVSLLPPPPLEPPEHTPKAVAESATSYYLVPFLLGNPASHLIHIPRAAASTYFMVCF